MYNVTELHILPVLRNMRHEQFCQEFAAHGRVTRAAIAAGSSEASASSHGSRLLKRPEILARIRELQPRVEQQVAAVVNANFAKPVADRAWVLGELIENAKEARANRDRAAANRALELVGKELGMFVERKLEMKSPLDALSPTELAALLDKLTSGPFDKVQPGPLPTISQAQTDMAIADSSTPTVEIIELSAVGNPTDEPEEPDPLDVV